MGTKLKIGGALLALTCLTAPAYAQSTLPTVDVWASRTNLGIVGASNSVIAAEDIQRSPGTSLQDILAREAGIQISSQNSGKAGVGSTIDMRGFGAAASSNTLILVNGRRMADFDSIGFDLATIPRDSIERIEITRGNAGAVLYGDGAVGGVINIVTKTGEGKATIGRVEAGFGSFNQKEINGSASTSHGPYSVSVAGNAINSDGYRQNDYLRQRNGVGDLRYTGDQGKAWLNVTGDDQHIGLPGARLVDPTAGINLLATDPRGATTPTAYAIKQNANLTLGVSRDIAPGLELILDGNLRRKDQTAFSSLSGFTTSDQRVLTTASFTPRMIIDGRVLGAPTKVTAGIDFYDSSMTAKRSTEVTDPPFHTYDLKQQTLAAYWQEVINVQPSTDVTFGARMQQTRLSARDQYDATAPGGAFDAQATPLDSTEVQHALNLGFEHRFSSMFAVFGHVARAFRTPNVDDRIGVNAFPVDFNLKTQTSQEAEGGFKAKLGALDWKTSVYGMLLNNEIMFIPFPPIGANINLDPTRRFGVENGATYNVSESVRLKGSLTYTEAKFREGIYTGNDVPLVAKWTANAGVSWDIYQKYLTFDGVVRYVGSRRMDNDQANFQPTIPAYTTIDARIGGEVKNFFWSLSVQNLFNVSYYDYAAASSSTFGKYNAYPLAGRTFMAKAGATF
ncbi:MAG TPA: TonB-dependent receptor [Pseudolabrys sp.]